MSAHATCTITHPKRAKLPETGLPPRFLCRPLGCPYTPRMVVLTPAVHCSTWNYASANAFNDDLERFTATSDVGLIRLLTVVLAPPDTKGYDAVASTLELASYNQLLSF